MTDAIVNLVVLLRVILGCYRASGNRAYLYRLRLLAGGFALRAIASYRALRSSVDKFAQTGLTWRAVDLAGLRLPAVIVCTVRPACNHRMGNRLW